MLRLSLKTPNAILNPTFFYMVPFCFRYYFLGVDDIVLTVVVGVCVLAEFSIKLLNHGVGAVDYLR